MRAVRILTLLLVLAPLLVPLGYAAAQEAVNAVEVDEEESELGARSIRDWYDMGGWIMHGIVACSVLTLGLILERAWVLRRGVVIPRDLLSQLHEHLKRREIPKVLSLCSGSDSSIARVVRAGLLHFEQGLAHMQDAVDTAGSFEAALLRRNLPMLAALANIATMMGLLGTVLGMIESFDLIAKTGTGDARVVAGGIFQALVTTAAGLMVGISAIASHSFLRRRVEVLEADLEEIAFGMLEELSARGEAPEPPGLETTTLTPQEA